MEINRHRVLKLLFALLFIFGVSFSSASDDVVSVNAGEDQLVQAGDTVQLTGTVSVSEEHHGHHQKDGRHEDRSHHGHHKKKHGARHEHVSFWRIFHPHHDDDDTQINWVQTAGTPVVLQAANTLTPSFTAPTDLNADETLEFTIKVSDDDGHILASDTVSITVLVARSTISGRITSVDGTALANVSINVLSGGTSVANLSSGADGHFSVQLAAGKDVVMQLSEGGYADQVVPARSPKTNGNVFLDITMIARGAVQTFNVDAGASLSGDDGAAVTVAAGSFVDANGLTVTGNVDLTITPVNISNPASLAAFPGEFSGVLEGETSDTPIVSLGTVEFKFSQNGQPLQLGPGQSANVLIPIYSNTYQDGSPINLGDSIPLWSLNQDTGIWTQEGTGIVVSSPDSPTGLAMQATVSHFSWWNCDVSMNAALAVVTVYGPDSGTALIKARTSADIGWRPDTVETVGVVGTPTAPLHVPSNGEVCFWAEISFDNGSTGTTPEVCLTPPPSSTVNVDLVAPVAGPINIVTRPAATADVLDVTGYLGYPSRRIQVQPSTYETAVNYTILSGSLPAGLSLNPVTATSAEIAGIPAELGSFSAVVQATDTDGFTDTVTINYTVTADIPPPELEPNVSVQYNGAPATINLNDYSLGGPVDTWVLSENIISENGPPPAGLSLDPATGILTITDSCIFWQGDLTASNASGTVTVPIFIADWYCA